MVWVYKLTAHPLLGTAGPDVEVLVKEATSALTYKSEPDG